VLVCTAVFMLLLDITVVSVALPSIQRDLRASLPDLQWVSAAYALVLAVLLLPAATLGHLDPDPRIGLDVLDPVGASSALGDQPEGLAHTTTDHYLSDTPPVSWASYATLASPEEDTPTRTRTGRLRLGHVLGTTSRSEPVSAVVSRRAQRRHLTVFTQVRRRFPGL
jgi:hypothetical protein